MSMRTMLNLSLFSVLSVVAFMTSTPFASSSVKGTQANGSQNKNRNQGNNGGNASSKNGGANKSGAGQGNNQGFNQGNNKGGNGGCQQGNHGCQRSCIPLYIPSCDQSRTNYNTVPGAYNTVPGAYNTVPGAYNTVPGANNTVPGANNTAPGTDNRFLNNSLPNVGGAESNFGPGKVPGIPGPNGLGHYGPFATQRRALEVVQLFRAMGYPNTIQFHNGDGQYVLPRR